MGISTTETVGQIVTESPETKREFEKLGIDYCCGGNRTLAEACAKAKVEVDKVLALLETSTVNSGADVERNWNKEPLADLISHITSTHHEFVRSESPRIKALAEKVASVHGKNHTELLAVREQFSALAEELRVHLMKEEQILFPYVLRMEENTLAGEPAPPAMFGTVANPVRMMMQEHDAAGDFLRSLRSLTNGYKLPDDACISYRTLFDALKDFEADLHQHIHLENNVLFPRATAMEAGSRVP
ncbi:MAG TPA: iron-sulfur cluster repair di-iron protein [Candidatus Binatia bacterium]|nr:iron-sulfur cluster repair di-iron protein [Candidatus Binatia bacterium]